MFGVTHLTEQVIRNGLCGIDVRQPIFGGRCSIDTERNRSVKSERAHNRCWTTTGNQPPQSLPRLSCPSCPTIPKVLRPQLPSLRSLYTLIPNNMEQPYMTSFNLHLHLHLSPLFPPKSNLSRSPTLNPPSLCSAIIQVTFSFFTILWFFLVFFNLSQTLKLGWNYWKQRGLYTPVCFV